MNSRLLELGRAIDLSARIGEPYDCCKLQFSKLFFRQTRCFNQAWGWTGVGGSRLVRQVVASRRQNANGPPGKFWGIRACPPKNLGQVAFSFPCHYTGSAVL